MWTAFLQLWEALGGSLGVLFAVLVLFVVIWVCRRVDQRRENDQKEFWARVKAEREEYWARMEAESDERRARAKAESDERRARAKAESDERRTRAKAESDEFWARVKAEGDEFWARVKAEGDERRARARAESDEFWARVRAEGDEFWGKIDREREESKERDDRDHARLSSAIAALREDVRVLHGDVRVLLDRSDRPAGDEAGGGQSSRPYQVARQATPDQCEDDAKSSSDEPVAQTPVDSAAEDPAD